MKDIDELKTELDKQKIKNDNLKNELIKRRNDDEKNISEIRKEIENLKIAISNISQKELHDNKSENEANKMKKDIEKLDKNKKISKYSKYSKKEKISKKNEFSIFEPESDLNSKDEFKKDFEEKNTTNEMNSLKNDNKSKLICEKDNFSKIKVQNSDEIKLKENIDICKKMIVSSNNDNIKKEIIQLEKEEIKQDLNIKKAKFFEIENIIITNIGNDKGFENLYMVIDTNASSKDLLFVENTINHTLHKLTMNGPLLKGENLNILITLYINDPKIGEYTIFAYIREKPEGDNLSRPLKLTINLFEDPENNKRKEEEKKDYFKREKHNKRTQKKNENIYYKGVDIIKAEEILKELENEYNILSCFDEKVVINKIIELNFDREKLNNWICDEL